MLTGPIITDAARAVEAILRDAFPTIAFEVSADASSIKWSDKPDDGPSINKVQSVLLTAGWGELKTLGEFPQFYLQGRMVWFHRYDIIWQTVLVTPIPVLQELNEFVIGRNEKRLPKWKFKFASDFAMQVQPKLTRTADLLFEAIAIEADAVSVKMFTEPKTLYGTKHQNLYFKLICQHGATDWEFKPTRVSADHEARIRLKQRVLDAVTPQQFAELRPDLMLSAHCLCCGKALTDPVSMARWIGPECFGSASTNLPNIFKAEAAPHYSVLD